MEPHITTPEPEPEWSDINAPTGFDQIAEGFVANKADEFDQRTKNDIEGLLFLGYLTRDFNLYGHSFTVRTLRRAERLAALQVVSDYSETMGYADALQTAIVAASIVLLDGKPLTMPLGDNQDKNPISWIRQNFQIVGQWYDPVIEGAYNEIDILLMDQTKAFLELEGK